MSERANKFTIANAGGRRQLAIQSLKEVMAISGKWDDEGYQKRFESVFETTLKPDNKFVAARRKPEAEEGAAGLPATRPESK